MSRCGIAMLLAAFVLAAAACGDEGGGSNAMSSASPASAPPAPPSPSSSGDDERAVRQRVSTYLRTYVGGDGETACAQFTRELRVMLDERAREQGYDDCADGLSEIGRTIAEALPPELERLAQDPSSVVPRVDGDRATATLGGSGKRLALRREDGRWRIAEVGLG